MIRGIGSRKRTHQELCLIHSCIVGADLLVRKIQRQIQKTDLVIVNCGPYRPRHHCRRGGNDQLGTMFRRIGDRGFDRRIIRTVEICLCLNQTFKPVIQINTSDFLVIDPG